MNDDAPSKKISFPKGVQVVSLDNPGEMFNTIADALGEPRMEIEPTPPTSKANPTNQRTITMSVQDEREHSILRSALFEYYLSICDRITTDDVRKYSPLYESSLTCLGMHSRLKSSYAQFKGGGK